MDFFYSLVTNISIIFFFLIFIVLNKENLTSLKYQVSKIKPYKYFLIFLFIIITIYNLDYSVLTFNLKGGGFFYKLSHFLFNNNLLFIISFVLGVIFILLAIHIDKKIITPIILILLMSLNYQIYQKYFEPIFLILVATINKNYFIENILIKYKNTLIFYLLVFIYFVVAYINYYMNFTSNMVI